MNSIPETNFSELATLDWREKDFSYAQLKAHLPRPAVNSQTAAEAVGQIIEDVRARGMQALKDLALRFDHVELEHTRVAQAELDRALDELDPLVRRALEESISRAREFAGAQVPQDAVVGYSNGGSVTQRWVPVRRVGLYVPGGLAVYPSSVIMNTVPAQAAGVQSLALASPPQKEFGGLPHPTILAAAKLLGITEVHAMGGAQAVAAFAYGVDVPQDPRGGIEPVDVISGPGNVFVATAKRLVKGVVGIDAEAGPTEIAILADDSANPGFVAADMISQAEHDANAAAVLVTTSPHLAERVRVELVAQVAATKHTERVREALSGSQSAIILVNDIAQGIDVCNAYAAEHLEIMTADSEADAGRITAAGAIFVGDFAPVSLGDYCAGSNHVLPTSGTALHASGLNVNTFLKAIQVINYDKAALGDVAAHVINLANAEDLPAHGDAVAIRNAL
ncbi:histidinol dehydrogenase [Glutamicibacter sp.]|uniref:histidinol dehydrogenase n=1 Tax=Glutamicibacter sp. TaxID=1931995 RepID=UPI0028BF1030|nr:histidinol dehydrogenase [Glutamicibacter sp.]